MIKYLSLFSGIGAFEKALENLKVNYDLVNYCEINKYASYAYSILYNIPESKNLLDVYKVDGSIYNELDLLTYGFPCQDISLAGKCKGIIEGETRSGLLFEALRIIKESKPKVAIAENVKNLVSKMFIKDFNRLIKRLDELGYNSYWKVLNGINYNSAQSRERVFIVSIRKDIDPKTFKFTSSNNDFISINNFTESVVEEKYYCEEHKDIKKFLHDVNRKICNFKKPSKFGTIKIGELENDNLREMNKRIFSELGTSPTIVTGAHSVPKIVQCRIRRLTPLECWRLTGFEDNDYWNVRRWLEERFYGNKDKSDSQMYRMAGNSIVVQVAQGIFKDLEGILY